MSQIRVNNLRILLLILLKWNIYYLYYFESWDEELFSELNQYNPQYSKDCIQGSLYDWLMKETVKLNSLAWDASV